MNNTQTSRGKKMVELVLLGKKNDDFKCNESNIHNISPLPSTSATHATTAASLEGHTFSSNSTGKLTELLPVPLTDTISENDGFTETVTDVMETDNCMPSTSTDCFTPPLEGEKNFSDDSIDDPHYTPTNERNSASSSDDEQTPARPSPQHNALPKVSLRVLKREKKAKRNLGQSYKTLKGKVIPERTMKDLCACRMKCKERLSLKDRQAIFDEYWKMGSYVKRSAYMASLIEIEDKATERIRALDPEKQKFRTKTYKYFLPIHGQRKPVCRGCLLKILGESDNHIKTVSLKKRASIGGTQMDDMRGTAIPKNKISDLKREEIRNHILSFPLYESHYTRKTTSKKYLPSHLTLEKMHSLFCESNENSPSIKIYSQEFKKLHLSFKKPRVDTCFTCDKFKMKIQLSQDDNTRADLVSQHEQHQTEADNAYDEKGLDSKLYTDDETVQVYTFDLQQCLPTPSLSSSVAFYKRQLWTFNLTIHDNKAGTSVCYVWDETIAGRGANQIASCIYKHLLNNIPEGTKHVVFYSDTCGGQNRNSHVSSMFTWVLQKTGINVIDHKFMIPGHSHLDVDNDHSIIEKKKKRTEIQIYHPHDWIQLIKSSSKKFLVVEMKNTDFLEFSCLLKGPLVLRNKDTDGRVFKWLEKRWLRYEKEFGVIAYKDALNRESEFQFINMKRRGSTVPDDVPVISVNPIPISKQKKDDLVSLLPLIPVVFHNFYLSLTTVNNNSRNTDPDIIESEEEF